MKGEFILLGSSVSSGVPAIGNDWGVCDPSEPKNRRNRACALVRTERTTLVVDTGPDFRQQMNDMDIAMLDAVLYTHEHSDHIQGIDELRVVSGRMRKLVDIYGNETTISGLLRRFDYLFEEQSNYKKVLKPHVIRNEDYGTEMKIGDISFVPFYQNHGNCICTGYRFGNVGYSADMLSLPEESIEVLKGIEIWIADGAGHHMEDHRTHAPLSRIYELNKQIQASKVYITGLSKFMDYQILKGELPAGFEPAYDGMSFSLKY